MQYLKDEAFFLSKWLSWLKNSAIYCLSSCSLSLRLSLVTSKLKRGQTFYHRQFLCFPDYRLSILLSLFFYMIMTSSHYKFYFYFLINQVDFILLYSLKVKTDCKKEDLTLYINILLSLSSCDVCLLGTCTRIHIAVNLKQK
jgi:hypothetical protein